MTESEAQLKVNKLKSKMSIQVSNEYREYAIRSPKKTMHIVFSNERNVFTVFNKKPDEPYWEMSSKKEKVFNSAQEVEDAYKRLSGFSLLDRVIMLEQSIKRVNNMAKKHSGRNHFNFM